MSQSLPQLLHERVDGDGEPLTVVARELDDTSYDTLRRAATREGIDVQAGGARPVENPATDGRCVEGAARVRVQARVSDHTAAQLREVREHHDNTESATVRALVNLGLLTLTLLDEQESEADE